MEQKNRNTVEKELLKAKDEGNMNVTNEKYEVNGKNKEMKKVTKEEKCSPERLMKRKKEAEEEKREGSAKKKSINCFFGELLIFSLICLFTTLTSP